MISVTFFFVLKRCSEFWPIQVLLLSPLVSHARIVFQNVVSLNATCAMLVGEFFLQSLLTYGTNAVCSAPLWITRYCLLVRGRYLTSLLLPVSGKHFPIRHLGTRPQVLQAPLAKEGQICIHHQKRLAIGIEPYLHSSRFQTP